MVQLFLGERQPVTCFVDNEILCWPWLPNLLMHTHIYSGFPGDTSGKEPASQFKRGKRCGFNPWVRKIWRRNWLPTPVFLPGKSHGQRSLAGYSPRGPKESAMTERVTNPFIFTSLFSCHTLTPSLHLLFPSLLSLIPSRNYSINFD